MRRLEQDTEAFWERFDIVDYNQPDMLDFNQMSQRMLTNNAVLWRLLGDGALRRIGRVPGQLLWPSIRMPAIEVFEAIVGSKDVLTTVDAANLMGLYPDLIRKLAAGGQLARRTQSTSYPTGLTPLFDRTTVESFSATYMSVKEVYRALRQRPRQTTLSSTGLRPVIEFTDNAGKTIALYERAAVMALRVSHR